MSLIRADARHIPLVDGCVQCVVTSPPFFGLRDYGTPGQIGLEPTPEEYVQALVQVFREVWRVLRDDGTLWLNLGDSYGTEGSGQNFCDPNGRRPGGGRVSEIGGMGHRKQHGLRGFHKQLIGIPWRVAFALQGFAVVPFRSFSTWADELKEARINGDWIAVEIIEHKLRCMDLLAGLQASGWYLRSDIIWSKPNPMPESVTDRPTKAHEYLFLLTKQERYYYDAAAIAESSVIGAGAIRRVGADVIGRTDRRDEQRHIVNNGIRNKRSVWTVATQPYAEAHFATWPPKLIEPCILAGSRPGDLVLDPFCGTGTTLAVAERFGRRAVGTDLSYQELARERTAQRGLRFGA